MPGNFLADGQRMQGVPHLSGARTLGELGNLAVCGDFALGDSLHGPVDFFVRRIVHWPVVLTEPCLIRDMAMV